MLNTQIKLQVLFFVSYALSLTVNTEIFDVIYFIKSTSIKKNQQTAKYPKT